MYTLYGSPRTRTMRVIWALEELGQPYELRQSAPRSEEVRALNPSGKVPVMTDGEAVLTDSLAILTFLADRHGGLTHRAGSHERARQDALTNLVVDEFDAILWSAAKHSFVLPEHERRPEIKEALRAEFVRSEAMLETRLTGPWLMGDDFLICDIMAVHCLGWARAAGFGPESDVLADYARRGRARPAFGRAARTG